MIVLVCGKVGAGKTTVARMLRERLPQARLVEADEIGHAVLRIPEVKEELQATFGKDIAQQGEISRPELAKRAFASDAARKRLNSITHPHLMRQLHQIAGENTGLTIIVAALPAELGLLGKADLIVEIRTPAEIVLARNKGRFPRLDERLRAQRGVQSPHIIIDNRGTLDQTRERVKELAERIQLLLSADTRV